MTHNQIAYQGNLIQEAANLEQARHNREQEAVQMYAQEVIKLNNQMQATLRRAELNEQARHNRESEAIAKFQNNIAQNTLLLDQRRAFETERHNAVLEAETRRSNRAQEYETMRTNKAKEAETSRSNVAREQETQRHNIVQEKLQKVDSFWKGVNTLSNALNAWVSAYKTGYSASQLLQ